MADLIQIPPGEKPDLSEPESDEDLRKRIIADWQMDVIEKAAIFLVKGMVLLLIMSALTRIFPAFLCGL